VFSTVLQAPTGWREELEESISTSAGGTMLFSTAWQACMG